MNAPDIKSIHTALERVHRFTRETPLLESELLNQALGGRLLVKAECLQRTGSFKFRGAINKISSLSDEQRKNGVVAFSSGNHAQGVAEAARLFGCRATIVMPDSAPEIKRRNTLALGAEVIEYDIKTESREEIGEDIARRTGAVLVRPYDDPDIISGQATVGLELIRQLSDRSIVPEQLVCPCGGGGLIAGTSIAIHESFPGCHIYAAEPEFYDDTVRSFEAGQRLSIKPGGSSLCDAIITPMPGELTFPINQAHLAGGLTVTDDEVLNAMFTAFERFKIVVEPGGAAALAGVLNGKVPVENKTTVVVCSGGNVDPAVFSRCLSL